MSTPLLERRPWPEPTSPPTSGPSGGTLWTLAAVVGVIAAVLVANLLAGGGSEPWHAISRDSTGGQSAVPAGSYRAGDSRLAELARSSGPARGDR